MMQVAVLQLSKINIRALLAMLASPCLPTASAAAAVLRATNEHGCDSSFSPLRI
jgi:hypothetical protein